MLYWISCDLFQMVNYRYFLPVNKSFLLQSNHAWYLEMFYDCVLISSTKSKNLYRVKMVGDYITQMMVLFPDAIIIYWFY